MKSFLAIAILGIILGASFAPQGVVAQKATEYTLLAPIPLSGPSSGETPKTTAEPYVKGVFTLIIAIAGGLAVIKIIFGGIQYMSTDAFEGKSEARTTIQNAIWGLLLAISAWLILFTINPKLVEFNFNLSIPAQATSIGVPSGPGGGSPMTGQGGFPLTQQQAISTFGAAGVTVVGPINLAGIRQGIVDEIVSLKNTCNCNVLITSATGGEHDTVVQPTCNHANGYKVDLRSNREGIALTNYVKGSYQPLPNRSDGAQMYRSPTGGFYALEGNHWDITRC